MEIIHNINTYRISWLANSYNPITATGIINNYYIPENLKELEDICISLFQQKEFFKIIGHTSNLYFNPGTNIKHLISTRKVNHWTIKDDFVNCETGVNVKRLVRNMIDNGFEGFAGLIDLPGTIGGALYGNASVSHYSISNLLESVSILTPQGCIETLSYEDMQFKYRSSAFKRKTNEGIILNCTLRLKKGIAEKEKEKAKMIHEWRTKNQPGPTNNLGTTIIINQKNTTFRGKLLLFIAKVINWKKTSEFKKKILLKMTNNSILQPYLFGLNRYIWKDEKAHDLFSRYLKFIRTIYNDVKLEIEIL